MQLELELAEPPAAAQALWDQIDPALQEALVQRLALVLAAAVARAAEESGNA